jgi:hypothetical protein
VLALYQILAFRVNIPDLALPRPHLVLQRL